MERSIQERLKGLRLSNDMIELLKSGQADNPLLCELAAHPDFIKLRILMVKAHYCGTYR